MRLRTKKDRENARAGWINGRITEKYKDIEILTDSRTYTHNGRVVFSLVIWKGTAGNPAVNYVYRTEEQREEALKEYKLNADWRAEYKNKLKNKKKTLSTHAECAKLIRGDLSKAYPQIKFSVTSESYAGGSSVRAEWENGPSSDQIDDIIQKYQMGHFDGMIDLYEYSNRQDFAQVKYVFANRKVAKETKVLITSQLCAFMSVPNDSNQKIPDHYLVNVRGGLQYVYNLVYQIAVNYDFTKGFMGVRKQLTEKGLTIENMFELY